MYKIGDFSKLGQVSTRMLRHYDQLGLLVPDYIDKRTGYRYYTIQQLPQLHRIIALKDMGLSLQQITDLISSNDELPTEQLRGILALKRSEIAREIQGMQQQLEQVEARLALLDQHNTPPSHDIIVKSIPSMPVASIRKTVPQLEEMAFYCEVLAHALYRKLQAAHIDWAEPELTLYHNDEFRLTDLEVETCVALPEVIKHPANADKALMFRELPACDQVAALIYTGPFHEVTTAVMELLRWIGVQEYMPAGPLRELHLSGPAHPETESDETPVIELQIPFMKAHA